MHVGGPKNPFVQQQRPVQAPRTAQVAGPQAAKTQGPRVQGDVMRQASAGLQPPPGGLDSLAMLGLARTIAFSGKRFERGARLHAEERLSHRSPSSPGLLLGSYELRGAMSSPGAHTDISTAHPLYGRYLEKWLSGRSDAGSGKVLLGLLRDKLGEMKSTIRKVL